MLLLGQSPALQGPSGPAGHSYDSRPFWFQLPNPSSIIPRGHPVQLSGVLGFYFRIKIALFRMFPMNIPKLRAGSKVAVVIPKYSVHVISSQFLFLRI